MSTLPGYWMNERSGVLKPAIEAYLMASPLTGEDIAAIRAYLRQWINAGCWYGPRVDELRASVAGLTGRAAIRDWLALAEAEGIDPL